MKDYVNIYKLQAGGAMGEPPAQEVPTEAPAQEPAGDQDQQIQQVIMQILETGDCDMALQLIATMAEQMGMTPPQGGAPQEAAPQEAPAFKRGGKMGMKKMKKGKKTKNTKDSKILIKAESYKTAIKPKSKKAKYGKKMKK